MLRSAVGLHGKTGVALAKFGSNSTTFPSALCMDTDGSYIYGTAALKKMQKPGYFGVRWGKRLIGRTYEEAHDGGCVCTLSCLLVQVYSQPHCIFCRVLEKVPFHTKPDPQNSNQILVKGKCFVTAYAKLISSGVALLCTVAEDKYVPLVSAMGLLLDEIMSKAKKSLGVTVRHLSCKPMKAYVALTFVVTAGFKSVCNRSCLLQ